MVFDREGRLFVGDSTGKINVWRINIAIDEVKDLSTISWVILTIYDLSI